MARQVSLRRKQIASGVIFAALIVTFSIVVTGVLQTLSDETLTRHSLDLTSAHAAQVQMNVDAYFQKVEKVAALLYSDEAYYKYDAADPSIGEYEKIQAENVIEARIIDLGMMENFCDFAVVYGNDTKVGWVSQVTSSIFPSGEMYDVFAAAVLSDPKQEAWRSSVMGNLDRIYYAKRLNPNAIVVLSFYASELNNTFAVPEGLEGLTVRLVGTDDQIIYSSDRNEVGERLPDEESSLIEGEEYAAVYDDETLVTVDTLDNGWRIVCSEPMSVLLADSVRLRGRMALIAGSLAVVALAVAYLVSRSFNRSVNTVVDNLSAAADLDGMTGLLNKTAYHDAVVRRLDQAGKADSMAFLMCDLDNFKRVNDQLGHQRGDEVIRRMGSVLNEVFSKLGASIGRVGGDEFSVFIMFEDTDVSRSRSAVHDAVERAYSLFDERLAEERAESDLSLSVGATIAAGEGNEFEELYHRADGALYVSKNSGKGKATYG